VADHSKTEICNRALQKVGDDRVVDLAESSPRARAVNLAYDYVREALLQAHPWSFAVKRSALAADASAPEFGRERAFAFPADCLRLLPPYPEDDVMTREWQVEGRKIYTDEEAPLKVRYIANIEDTTLMPPLFRELLSCAIAVEICEQLTQSNTKRAQLREEMLRTMRRAQMADTQEQPPTGTPDDDWITARL
jgi:hypothetical protein